jgi:hypothetical protein
MDTDVEVRDQIGWPFRPAEGRSLSQLFARGEERVDASGLKGLATGLLSLFENFVKLRVDASGLKSLATTPLWNSIQKLSGSGPSH